MIRTLTALGLAATALVAMWAAIWGLIVIGWMPGATAEDMAWRFTLGVLAFALLGFGLSLIGLAGMVLAPVVSAVYDRAMRRV